MVGGTEEVVVDLVATTKVAVTVGRPGITKSVGLDKTTLGTGMETVNASQQTRPKPNVALSRLTNATIDETGHDSGDTIDCHRCLVWHVTRVRGRCTVVNRVTISTDDRELLEGIQVWGKVKVSTRVFLESTRRGDLRLGKAAATTERMAIRMTT